MPTTSADPDGYALGIDVGTTFTAAAIWRDDRAEAVALGDRANAIPSVLFLRDDGVLLVGDAANRRAVLEPANVAREFKRRIGDRVPLLLGGKPFTPQALTGHVIRWVVESVSEREGGPPRHVTLTCPAHWGDHRRALMREAAGDAGLSEAGLLTEPHAAAVFYAAQRRIPTGALVGIYDLGGGTFDATVLSKTATGFELLGSPAGDPELGGVDFDQIVLRHVRAGVGACWPSDVDADPVTRQALSQLHASAVDAKEALSIDTDARVAVILPDCTAEVRLTRGEFEEAVRTPLLRTVEVFRQTLSDAGVAPDALHAVLLTGGSSRIPLIAELLTGELGVQISTDAHPKFAVCLGAAITAAAHLQQQAPATTEEPDTAAPPATAEEPDTVAPLDTVAPPATAAPPERRTPRFVPLETQRIDVNLASSGLTRAADVPLPPVATRSSHAEPVQRVTDEDAQPLVVRLGEAAPGSRPWLAPLLIVGAMLLAIAVFAAFAASAA
jgi:molecular chaperone DnaK (HSP70)